MMKKGRGGCGGMRLSSLLLVIGVLLCPMMAKGRGGPSYFSKRRYCDVGNSFPRFEDQSFVEMLHRLLEESRSMSSRVEVLVRDEFERFEGRAMCLGHNCQMYDSECYPCDNMRDAEACIEIVIAELELSLRDSSSISNDRHCLRTREFSADERIVAVDDAATMFQVCGIQYKYLGDTLALDRRSVN